MKKLPQKMRSKIRGMIREMWRGNVGSCGPSSRVLLIGETPEIRNEAGSLHSWYVPGAITIASRDAGTSSDSGWSIEQLDEMIDYAIDHRNF